MGYENSQCNENKHPGHDLCVKAVKSDSKEYIDNRKAAPPACLI